MLARSVQLDAFHLSIWTLKTFGPSYIQNALFETTTCMEPRCEIVKLHFRHFVFFFEACIFQRISLTSLIWRLFPSGCMNSIIFYLGFHAMLLLEVYMLFVCYSMINIQCSHRICIKKIPLNRLLAENKTFIQPDTHTHIHMQPYNKNKSNPWTKNWDNDDFF